MHGITGHNFETRHPSDDSDQVWFPLVKYFQRRRFLKKFTTYHGRQVIAIADLTLWVRWAKNWYSTNKSKITVLPSFIFYLDASETRVEPICLPSDTVQFSIQLHTCSSVYQYFGLIRLYYFNFKHAYKPRYAMDTWLKLILTTRLYLTAISHVFKNRW